MVKAQTIATFPLTNPGSCSSHSIRTNIGELKYTKKGAVTREGLSNII